MKPTQEQVIAWAREAGVWARLPDTFQDEFKAFAALAYEAGRKDAMSLPKVSPYEFLKAVEGKENVVGIPIFWSEWPTAQGENNDT